MRFGAPGEGMKRIHNDESVSSLFKNRQQQKLIMAKQVKLAAETTRSDRACGGAETKGPRCGASGRLRGKRKAGTAPGSRVGMSA